MEKLHKDPGGTRKDYAAFISELHQFHQNRGTPFRHTPRINGREVDLFSLYNLVTNLGGWQKVNDHLKWDYVLDNLHFPKACVNSALALRQIYVRYLSVYEKINFMGEDPDDETDPSTDSRIRKHNGSLLLQIPMSYNHAQHEITDQQRIAAGLPAAYQPVEYDKLCLSLMSGLPNEEAFTLNVCTLLSNERGHILHLEKAPQLVPLLLSQAGIFPVTGDQTLRKMYVECWKDVEGRRMERFWEDNLEPEVIEMFHIGKKEEDVYDELFNLTYEVGTRSIEGQRVMRVALIFHNLSFEEHNVPVLASNKTFIRFVTLCALCRWSSLRQVALDTIGNLASQLVLNLKEDLCSKTLIKIMKDGIQSQDKYLVMRCLDILANICQSENNEDQVIAELDIQIYHRIFELLTVHDLMLLIYALEALYTLSEIGKSSCDKMLQVHKSVGILVSLLTLDPLSYGPSAQKGMKLIETYEPAFANAVPVKSTVSAPPVHASVTASPVPQGNTSDSESETFACSWIRAAYEAAPGHAVPRNDFYAEYVTFCSKAGKKSVVSATIFANCVKSVFPSSGIKKVESQNGTIAFHHDGIRKKIAPSPIHVTSILTVSTQSSSVVNPSRTPSPMPVAPNHSPILKAQLSAPLRSMTPPSPTPHQLQQAFSGRPVPSPPSSPHHPPNPAVATPVVTSSSSGSTNLIKSLLASKVSRNLQKQHVQNPNTSPATPVINVALVSTAGSVQAVPNTLTVQAKAVPVSTAVSEIKLQATSVAGPSATRVSLPDMSSVSASTVMSTVTPFSSTTVPAVLSTATPTVFSSAMSTAIPTVTSATSEFVLSFQPSLVETKAPTAPTGASTATVMSSPVAEGGTGQQLSTPLTAELSSVTLASNNVNGASPVTNPASGIQVGTPVPAGISLLSTAPNVPIITTVAGPQISVESSACSTLITAASCPAVETAAISSVAGSSVLTTVASGTPVMMTVSAGTPVITTVAGTPGISSVTLGTPSTTAATGVTLGTSVPIAASSLPITTSVTGIPIATSVAGLPITSLGPGSLASGTVTGNLTQMNVVGNTGNVTTIIAPVMMMPGNISNLSGTNVVVVGRASSVRGTPTVLINPQGNTQQIVPIARMPNIQTTTRPMKEVLIAPAVKPPRIPVPVTSRINGYQRDVQLELCPQTAEESSSEQVEEEKAKEGESDVQFALKKTMESRLKDKIGAKVISAVPPGTTVVLNPSSQIFRTILGASEDGNEEKKTSEVYKNSPLLNGLLDKGKVPLLLHNGRTEESKDVSDETVDSTKAEDALQANGQSSVEGGENSAMEISDTKQPVKTETAEVPVAVTGSDLSSISDIARTLETASKTISRTNAECNQPLTFSGPGTAAVVAAVSAAAASADKPASQQPVNQRICVVTTKCSNTEELIGLPKVSMAQLNYVRQGSNSVAIKRPSPIVVETPTKRPKVEGMAQGTAQTGNQNCQSFQTSSVQKQCDAAVTESDSTSRTELGSRPNLMKLLNSEASCSQQSTDESSKSPPANQKQAPKILHQSHHHHHHHHQCPKPAKLVYICEWKSCGRTFATPTAVFFHACKVHIPETDGDLKCEWETCDDMKRKRLSLVTHLQDRHCNEQVLQIQAVRRQQISQFGKASIPPPPQPPPHPGYAPDAAYLAIRRHALQFYNHKDASDEKESALAKSIRLTSALVLRNLATHSSLARCYLRRYEQELSCIAMSALESSRTVAQCLLEMSRPSN